jgi:hypothetical protein
VNGVCVEWVPKCAYIDPPSINQWEYLPFRWDLELWDNVDYQARTCDTIDSTKQIPAWSMLCTFRLYNWVSREAVSEITKPCAENEWKENDSTLFEDFVFEEQTLWRSSFRMTDSITNWVLGEYQLDLEQVDYVVCGSWLASFRGVSDNRICSMNFAVSDDYVITQWSSLTTRSNTDLSKFRGFDGSTILDASQLQATRTTSLTTLDTTQLEDTITSFVAKHVPLAVVQTSALRAYTNQPVTKTVNNNIFLYDGNENGWINSKSLVISTWDPRQVAGMTVIVKNADLIIEWSVAWNVMRVVPDGNIIFRSNDCDERDIVDWIYVTSREYKTEALIDGEYDDDFKNTDLWRSEWCDDWRLVINGILLWPTPTDKFIGSRRASLWSWFNIGVTDQISKVYNGASLLLRSNPTIWSNLPDGIASFEGLIDIFR